MPHAELPGRLDDLADLYLQRHRQKERLFWETKMGLSEDDEALHEAEIRLRRFVGDPDRLSELRAWRAQPGLSARTASVLDGWIEMLRRNVIEDPRARDMERDLLAREVDLERRRQEMDLGYVDPGSGRPVAASSIVLGTMVHTEPEESRRRAAWQALRSIEDFALEEGFAEIVRSRNALARRLGHADYYEYKVQWAEGFDKQTLFGILDELERRTAAKARREVERLAAGHPWNHPWRASGSLAAEQEPHFAFGEALDRWGRSFAGWGIHFRGAQLVLDLVDRRGKYENGFMHGPTPAFRRRGVWLPAEINIAANAVPDQVGAGRSALVTLFHEGGHAAHFANIVTDAPCFSQEFAPTSTAFSETQSMFLDQFVDDPAWQSRYALDEEGRAPEFDLLRRGIQMRQPHAAWRIRSMLAVCYAEKEIYELSDEEIRPERIREICRDVERRMMFYEEGGPRPMLSVPHLLSSDASCYYHGYVLALLAVEQTRRHLEDRHGPLVDNPRVGEELSRVYWQPGNAVRFLDYVQRLTGRPLSSDDLVRRVNREVDVAVEEARESIEALRTRPAVEGAVDLDVRLRVVHGAEEVVGLELDFASAAERFRSWVNDGWSTPSGPRPSGKPVEPTAGQRVDSQA